MPQLNVLSKMQFSHPNAAYKYSSDIIKLSNKPTALMKQQQNVFTTSCKCYYCIAFGFSSDLCFQSLSYSSHFFSFFHPVVLLSKVFKRLLDQQSCDHPIKPLNTSVTSVGGRQAIQLAKHIPHQVLVYLPIC